MESKKCQFCGSESLKVETPFVKFGSSGDYEKQYTYCCNAQKRNRLYAKKHVDNFTQEAIYSDDEITSL